MGKQTKKAGSHFGGKWTEKKLLIIDEYLKAYSKVLKNTKVKKIYIDAFAGSGKTILENNIQKSNTLSIFEMFPELSKMEVVEENNEIEGSALLSLHYDFDEYYFLEIDENRIECLKSEINEKFLSKKDKVHFIKGNSNIELKKILKNIKVTDRCLLFLDPYSLELEWNLIEEISKYEVIDLWYLFPLNAISRIIPKDRKKLNKNEKLISTILGTEEWEKTLYEVSLQGNIFDEEIKTRVEFSKLKEYIKNRFAKLFPYVYDKDIILYNEAKNSPLFLLCFMMTNKSEKAINLANRLVDGIKKKVEKW